jgi:hypothetical protein
MDGFSSSLHVKGATAKRVQQAVTDLLSAEGFQVSNADDDQPAEDQPITRGVWIAKTKGDWVSLFCSDFLFQQEIGRELSKQLKTHALNVWVNEGSSWHYSLFHNGEEVDQFDSTGGTDELQEFLDNDMQELAEEFDDDETEPSADDAENIPDPAGDELDDSPIQEGLTRIAELQEQIAGKMPPDVRAIYDKLNEGQASLGDMRKFDQWSQANQAELARFQDELQQHTAELTATMQGVFQQGVPENWSGAEQELLQDALPPDIAELLGKVLTGSANGEELRRFTEQISEADEEDDGDEAGDDDIEEAFFGDTGADESAEEEFDEFEDDGERRALTEQQLQIHLGALRPLLDKSVDADEITETLTNQDEMPEEPLGELLSLLGIEGNLALLDFDALENLSDEDLTDQGIKLSPLLLVRSA